MTEERQLLGTVLQDTYLLERQIGEGGMGIVYEASHLRLRRRFAIKLLFSSIASDQEALARFRREGEITSELGHANIIEVIDFNYAPSGAPYIVMELLHGESLGQRLERGPRLDLGEVITIFQQTASALQVTHRHGIIHRDLKPQNIFLCQQEDSQTPTVKVLDFGISKVLGSQSVVTRTTTVLGTPSYMAPEQAEGRVTEVSPRTDIFALGAILYEMLANRPAFYGETIPAVLYQVVHQDPASLGALRPDLPTKVEAVIRRAMKKQPADRYPTAGDFAKDLVSIFQEPEVVGEGITSSPFTTADDHRPGSVEYLDTAARSEPAGWQNASDTSKLSSELAPKKISLPAPVLPNKAVFAGPLSILRRSSRTYLLTTLVLVLVSATIYLGVRLTAGRSTVHPGRSMARHERPTLVPGVSPSPPAPLKGGAAGVASAAAPATNAAAPAVDPTTIVAPTSMKKAEKDKPPTQVPLPEEKERQRKSRGSGQGRLNVVAWCGGAPGVATIYLSGRILGQTPLQADHLPVGRYKVRARMTGCQDYMTMIQIRPNKREVLRLRLNRQ